MNINGYNFTLGADPEIFVKAKLSNKLTSAHNLIPGTKQKPYKIKDGAVQVDGMALEFNINPVNNYKDWENNLTSVLNSLTKMVPGYEILIEPVAEFGADYIQSQPKEARELGCDPDFDAYEGRPNPRPEGDAPFRTASGHVHIGWQNSPVDPNDPGHIKACELLAKTLDYYIGVPSLLWDRDTKRRKLYGKAGAYRPKPYGMEYRTLSNTWLKSKLLRKFVFENTILAIKACFEEDDSNRCFNRKFEGFTARDIINFAPGVDKMIKLEINDQEVEVPLWHKLVPDLKLHHNVPFPRDYANDV